MTDNEIIKAAECYLESKTVDECVGCNFLETDSHGFHFCCLPLKEAIIRNLLDLINRQKAEIERLEKSLTEQFDSYENIRKKAKAEAVKEFAERVKANILHKSYPMKLAAVGEIDNLVKEFTEGGNDG